MSSAVLRVDNLGVAYGALVALDAVSWSVDAGEILGIIGPNGAGKSSCYDATTNMTRRTGKVFLAGENVTHVPPHRLAERGLRRAFQQNAFFSEFSILENMVAVLQDRHGTGLMSSILAPMRAAHRRHDAEKDAREALLRFGIPVDCHGLRPGEISYGTQRMLSIALAYGSGARVLLLDEPAAGLGGDDMKNLINVLVMLRQTGVALVVIEHHMDLIMSVASQITVLNRGRVLASGTPAQIQADPQVLEAYLGHTQ